MTANIGSASKLKRIEKGKSPVRELDVRAMGQLYGLDETIIEQLVTLAKHTKDHGWWEVYGAALPKWMTTYMALESAAVKVLTWDPELIHGLLQTKGYQRAIFQTHPDASTPDYADEQIRFRSDRQRAAFDRDPPVHVQAVIGEGALRRLVGGQGVMAEQVAHLVQISNDAYIDVRVLPFSAGAHAAMTSAFTIIEFDEGVSDVVYLETYAGGRYVEDDSMPRDYRDMFDSILAASTPLQEYKP